MMGSVTRFRHPMEVDADLSQCKHSMCTNFRRSLKGSLQQVFNDCSCNVVPPSVTTRRVQMSCSFYFIGPTRWLWNTSRMRHQTVLTESSTRPLFIQPFSSQHTMTRFGKFSFGIHLVLCLKATYGGSLRPSTVHNNMTVTCVFLLPLVQTGTLWAPFSVTAYTESISR